APASYRLQDLYFKAVRGELAEVQILQTGSDRTATTFADLASVEFTDRQHFCRCTGEEGFISHVDFVAGDAFFTDRITAVSRQLEDGIAGDAVKAGGQLRGVDHTIANQEEVLAT